jgi:hypothetical protein
MTWLKGKPRFGQFLVLVLLVVALFGPWLIWDLIYVPAQSDCDPPWLRLEGDYCGMPYSGLAVLGFGIRALLALVGQVLSGSDFPADLLYVVLIIGGVCTLLLLPYASTLLRLASANRRPGRIFAAVVWGLAAAAGVVLILAGTRHPFYLMWGIWLLTGLALVMLVVEVRQLRAAGGSQPPPEGI